METKPIDIFSEASNLGVVRLPGRRFPSLVLQGDTLASLVTLAGEVALGARDLGDDEYARLAEELHRDQGERLAHYEAVLKAHGMGRPF